MGPYDPLNDRSIWFECRNDSGVDIPAYGVVRITGQIWKNQTRMLKVSGFSNYDFGAQYDCGIVGGAKIPAGKFGRVQVGGVAAGLYYDADGTPAWGEAWGPIGYHQDHYLRKNVGGFQVVGTLDDVEGKNIVLVRPCPLIALRAVLTEDLEDGGQAEATPCYWDGSAWQQHNVNYAIQVREGIGIASAIDSGTTVFLNWENTSREFVVVSASCA